MSFTEINPLSVQSHTLCSSLPGTWRLSTSLAVCKLQELGPASFVLLLPRTSHKGNQGLLQKAAAAWSNPMPLNSWNRISMQNTLFKADEARRKTVSTKSLRAYFQLPFGVPPHGRSRSHYTPTAAYVYIRQQTCQQSRSKRAASVESRAFWRSRDQSSQQISPSSSPSPALLLEGSWKTEARRNPAWSSSPPSTSSAEPRNKEIPHLDTYSRTKTAQHE